jgi:hypothetical protein
MLVGLESLFLASPVFQAFFGGFDDGSICDLLLPRRFIKSTRCGREKDQWLVVGRQLLFFHSTLFLLQYRCTFCDTFL